MSDGHIIPCSLCGCIGNESCGHEPLGNDCTLEEPELVCPCCLIDPNHAKHAQEKRDKQMELFA